MKLGCRLASESNENYLKAILILQQRMEHVRRVDLANYLGYSKASITHGVSLLQKKGYLEPDRTDIVLTSKGLEAAEHVLKKHKYFTKFLINCGVDRERAEQEACELEHAVSDESFLRVEETYQFDV